ncbi:Holliday junction branch migration protein RuvA [candidate division KSB1 bacterium]|nr:Holliday junction branch migration protein RuvA [candidate division KSB1 bacterium]
MLAFLRGKIVELSPHALILDVNGVGYYLQIPATTFAVLRASDDEIEIRTFLHVRESALALFGFATAEERDLFLDLLSVTGIGPKLALTILSSASVHQLYQSIAAGQENSLTRISGLGKKTAQRLLLDLKDRAIERLKSRPDWVATPERKRAASAEQAVQALIALGFTQAEAERSVEAAMAELGQSGDVEQVIQAALKR